VGLPLRPTVVPQQPQKGPAVPRIWTIGHSNHTPQRFLELLRRHGILCVADVRRHPFSRRHPHVSRAALERLLVAEGMGYHHFEDLGGRREPLPHSSNTAIADPGLRGYADWATGPAFRAALEALRALATATATAVMCAEADPARCHRTLLADHLAARGFEVRHILADGGVVAHRMHDAARVGPDGVVVYPAPQGDLFA
jgi:uncharacterized protein (DUF488 family)